jgi:hypothetical protein
MRLLAPGTDSRSWSGLLALGSGTSPFTRLRRLFRQLTPRHPAHERQARHDHKPERDPVHHSYPLAPGLRITFDMTVAPSRGVEILPGAPTADEVNGAERHRVRSQSNPITN